ncbi:MAG: PadR family transcriptional regulator [Thermoplasmata archaeon]
MKETEWTVELKKGIIPLCILATLEKKKKYGFQIIKELREISNGYLDLKEGTLYPALHRLEQKGYVKSEWVIQEQGIPRKYYTLTETGKAALSGLEQEWEKVTKIVERVVRK